MQLPKYLEESEEWLFKVVDRPVPVERARWIGWEKEIKTVW